MNRDADAFMTPLNASMIVIVAVTVTILWLDDAVIIKILWVEEDDGDFRMSCHGDSDVGECIYLGR